MGADRELKKANEAYWADKLSRDDLLKEGKRLRLEHWKIQKDAGVDVIPSNDFAFYDHLLDHIQLFNVSSLDAIAECKSSNKPRLSQSATPSTRYTSSMSTLPWAVATRRMASMFPVW